MVPHPVKHAHAWEIISYRLSPDRLTVSITDHCKACEQARRYDRPNKRLCN